MEEVRSVERFGDYGVWRRNALQCMEVSGGVGTAPFCTILHTSEALTVDINILTPIKMI